jgi:hypothetical protein
LATVSWSGGTYTAFTGERVTVFVSTAYAADPGLGQRWANSLAGLVHGSELGLVRVYVAPPAEIHELCGADGVLGCYTGSKLITPGETVEGMAPEEVLRHEYGHHVAANRRNPPWTALDTGTKRWASGANVCRRATMGTAFPGDEGLHYTLNPGEAFAEAYRVLNDLRGGAPGFTWDLADSSFRPDASALAAVEQDVLDPWTQPPTRIVTSAFAGKARAVAFPLDAPLDGELTVTLRAPLGATHSLELLSADGRTVLARGLWSGTGKQRLTRRICGERSFVLRVTRHTGPARFALSIDAPR